MMQVTCEEDSRVKYRSMLSLIGCILLLTLSVGTILAEEKPLDFSKVPVNGMVTMIDLGAKSCIPCKMMAPIMTKLEKLYQGKAAIVFIDVWENREQAIRFRVSAIPTQIFFDSQGKEVYRHVGFMGEEAITGQLKKMGVN
jgi:thioredoxin 1